MFSVMSCLIDGDGSHDGCESASSSWVFLTHSVKGGRFTLLPACLSLSHSDQPKQQMDHYVCKSKRLEILWVNCWYSQVLS